MAKKSCRCSELSSAPYSNQFFDLNPCFYFRASEAQAQNTENIDFCCDLCAILCKVSFLRIDTIRLQCNTWKSVLRFDFGRVLCRRAYCSLLTVNGQVLT